MLRDEQGRKISDCDRTPADYRNLFRMNLRISGFLSSFVPFQKFTYLSLLLALLMFSHRERVSGNRSYRFRMSQLKKYGSKKEVNLLF